MAESEGEKTAQFLTGPIGGFLIAAFLYPTGCAKFVPITTPCPAGEETNILGLTVFGLVGRLDTPGLFVLGIVLAVIGYFLVNFLTKPSSPG